MGTFLSIGSLLFFFLIFIIIFAFMLYSTETVEIDRKDRERRCSEGLELESNLRHHGNNTWYALYMVIHLEHPLI